MKDYRYRITEHKCVGIFQGNAAQFQFLKIHLGMIVKKKLSKAVKGLNPRKMVYTEERAFSFRTFIDHAG